MKVTVHPERAFALLDALVARWKKRQFPFNKSDAVIPQTIIPSTLRAHKKDLGLFYFYLCIYMRGGIESLQAFQALLRMRENHPMLFDPLHAQWESEHYVQQVLKEYIGWDARNASRIWVENSRRLVSAWNGNPLLLYKGVTTYDEATRRIRNKRTVRDLDEAGTGGAGFMGFQPKMVSMLTYFYDWEGLLRPRFPYPSPADFHNFRLALSTGALEVKAGTGNVRSTEALSAPWRSVVMDYIKSRKADPLDVADALWLFSLVMCGNSPLTANWKAENGSGMFTHEDLPHRTKHADHFLAPRYRASLATTCLRCPIRESCTLAIPARPYYTKGLLVLEPRLRVEDYLLPIHPDTPVGLVPTGGVAEQICLFESDTSY